MFALEGVGRLGGVYGGKQDACLRAIGSAEQSALREDLYYGLQVFEIAMSPLRNRPIINVSSARSLPS
jgi:hypothetical protein